MSAPTTWAWVNDLYRDGIAEGRAQALRDAEAALLALDHPSPFITRAIDVPHAVAVVRAALAPQDAS